MLRLRIYIENTTDIMFPTAVTINCQSLGLGMLRRFLLNPKNGTEPQGWNAEPWNPLLGCKVLLTIHRIVCVE